MAATALGAGATLLGGFLGNKAQKYANQMQLLLHWDTYDRQRHDALTDANIQREWAKEDQAEQFVRLRAAAEKAGINPLTALGAPGAGLLSPTGINTPGAPAPPSIQANNYMGTAIAEAGLMVADSLAKSRAAQQGRTIQDLNRQREVLQRRLTDATIRPRQPGVYERRRAEQNAEQTRGISVGAYRLGTVDVPEPKLDRANPGYFAGLSWEATPGFSPGQVWEDRYGDTPLNWPIAAGQMAADIGYNIKKAENYVRGYAFGAGPIMTINGSEWAMEEYIPKAKAWARNYQPWQGGGYDALTGSRWPAARINQ